MLVAKEALVSILAKKIEETAYTDIDRRLQFPKIRQFLNIMESTLVGKPAKEERL